MKRFGLAVIAVTVAMSLPGSAQPAPPQGQPPQQYPSQQQYPQPPQTAQQQQFPQQAGQQQQGGADADFDGNSPDHGVARLSLITGDVTVRRGDTGEAVAAELNAPLVALDHVLTTANGRAELQLDYSNMIRVGPASELRLGDLKDGNYLLQVADGTVTFRVLRDTRAVIEISTPTVSVRPMEKGTYRVTVRPDGSTEVTVRKGNAEIYTSRGTEKLGSGKTMEARGSSTDTDFMVSSAISKDDWDRWNETRDQDLERSNSYQYVSRDVAGAEDLDANGRWVYDAPYGNVWVPNVSADWAPYRAGRWTYDDYYGWNWLSADTWGWAPYHYGRWYNASFGWAWYPGVIGPRYYYRPALVSFFGWGGGYGGGFGFGFGNVGWVPLAPYEVYRPWYGRGGFGYGFGGRGTIVNNINITNVYRNARVGNGITSVHTADFGRHGVNSSNFVRASSGDISRAGEVRGALPLQASADSRRFSDRAANLNGTNQSTRSNADFARSPGQSANGAFGNRNGGGNGSNGVQRGGFGNNNASVQGGNRAADIPSRVNGQSSRNGEIAGNGNRTEIGGSNNVNGNVRSFAGSENNGGFSRRSAADMPSRVPANVNGNIGSQGGGFNRSSEAGGRYQAPRSSGYNPGSQGVTRSAAPQVYRSAPSAPAYHAPSGGTGTRPSYGGGGGSVSHSSGGGMHSSGGGGSHGGGGGGHHR